MTNRFSGPATDEAEPVSAEKHKRNSGDPHDRKPVPGVSVRELYDERNWTALGGLALIAVGVMYLLQDLIGFSFNLWSLLLLGVGGWLVMTGYQAYQAHGNTWDTVTRNRMIAGALIGAFGLIGMFDFNLWGLLLMGTGGWLGHDTWQKVENTGGEWTDPTRTRMAVAVALGVIGLFAFMNMGSAWSVMLIVFGGAMLYRHFNRHGG